MSDPTYARFSVPLSVLADPTKSEVVRTAFDLSTTEFQRIILSDPATDEAAGYEGSTVRLVDGRPCLVWEREDVNFGGTAIEDSLITARIPFIRSNGAGREYGPTSTVFTGTETELIRLDHNLEPIVGIALVDERVIVDPGEVADFERYLKLRAAVLLYPAILTVI